jgi:hypothetical protein
VVCNFSWPSKIEVGRSVKLLLVFVSTVIPGFRLPEIHDQDVYSLLDVYVFRNEASTSTKEGSVFLYSQSRSQSQSSFTTGGLPPISSSWRQSLETHDHNFLIT